MKGNLAVVVNNKWVMWPLVVTGSVVVLIGMRWLLGQQDWAGLGQWVGGLGAFYAAVVALNIARRESLHREEAEAQQDFVRANFIIVRMHGGILVVSNHGIEPIFNVAVVAFHRFRQVPEPERIPLFGSWETLLMPMLPPYTSQSECKPHWDMDLAADSMWTREKLLETPGDFEIEFIDLRGKRWSRRGDHVAQPVEK